MNKIIGLIAWGIIVAVLLSANTGCKTAEKAAKKPLKKRGSQFLLAKLQENELQYEWLSAKLSCEAAVNDKKTEVNIRLRHKKDSVIWLSVSPALGIEMARVVITPDSFLYLNRIEKSYYKGTIEYLNRSSPIELSFKALQSFLTGNAYFHDVKPGVDKSAKFKSSIQQNKYVLSTMSKRKYQKRLDGKTIKDTTLNRIWLEPLSFKIEKIELLNFSSDNQLIVAFNEITKTEGQLFPENIIIEMKAETNFAISFDYSRVEFNRPLTIPFSIPSKYERID